MSAQTISRDWSDLRTMYSPDGENLSSREIARRKGVTPATVIYHLSRQQIPIKPRNWRRMRHATLNPSPDFSYLIGALLGDGWISQPGHANRTEVHVTVEAFARRVAEAFEACGLHAFTTHRPDGTWVTTSKSLSFCEWWHATHVFKLLDFALQYPTQFVQGVFDAEGSLFHRRSDAGPRLVIDCSRSEVMAAILGVLTGRGYNCTTHVSITPGGTTMFRIAIQSQLHVARFLQEFPSSFKIR